jgi:hypothetical protein
VIAAADAVVEAALWRIDRLRSILVKSQQVDKSTSQQ